MSLQDPIDQLALAVLRSAPSMNRCAQQATFMRPFEKNQRLATVETSRDVRQASARRAPRETALAGATTPWPFCAREVWL